MLGIAIIFLIGTYSGFVPALEDHSSKMGEHIGKSLALENASDESESEESNIDGAVPTSDDEPRERELTDLSHS